MNHKLLTAAAAVLVIAMAVLALRAGGDSVRRPEGAAERLLHALSIDQPDQAARWADPTVTATLIAFDADDDTRFATIEIGRADTAGDRATIPARVIRNDPNDTAINLQLTAQRADPQDRWRIIAIDVVDRADVPSAGGARPARASMTLWLAVAAIAVLVAIAADVLITRLRPRGVNI